MKDKNCAYCMRKENPDLYEKFALFAFELESSDVYIFNEQSKFGRVIVAHKKHISDMTELTDEERNLYFSEINKVAKAMHKTFKPNKINFGAYGDTGCHLHFHLVPKYKDQDEWGSVFAMNPQKVIFSKEQLTKIANDLQKNL
ncbi:MAG: HIT family protein [Anaeroplasmataceae bacterium]